MRVQDLPAAARLTRARSQLVTNPAYAFFGTLALSLRLVEAPEVETMAVDGESLFYCPAFVESLSEAHLLGVVAHEVMHLATLHHVRRGGRDPEEWNRACDFAINPGILAAGLSLPSWVLRSAEFEGQGAEAIYAELMRRKPQAPPEAPPSADHYQDGEQDAAGGTGAGDDQDGAGEGDEDGEGEGGQPGAGARDPGRCGGVIDAPPEAGTMAEQAAEMEARVRQAVSVARAAQAGTLPGFLAGLVDELNAPRISWRDELASFVDDAATRAASWSRPNKRFLQDGFFLPGSVADSVSRIAVIVDTSGSIYGVPDVLSAFRTEIQGMLDGGRVEAVHVVHCDQSVKGTQDFTAGDVVDLRPIGGGGTAFSPAFRHVAEHAGDCAAVVYLTDLECGDFGPEPEVPVLWAAWGRYRPALPFGRVIPLDPYA